MIGNKLSVEDYDFEGKRVLIRVDYNVPFDGEGRITNNQRITASIPTIKYVLEHGARAVILMSHLGRPDGKSVAKYSLKPVANELERLLERPVIFLDDCVGDKVESLCRNPESESIILLENLRFHSEEEGSSKQADGTKLKSSPEAINKFRGSLSRLGDVYVNDAFGTVHRAHSSIVGVDLEPKLAGLLVKKELAAFSQLLETKERVDVAILGGAKVSDKIQLILNLLSRVNKLIIGGGMAFTFLKSKMTIGSSLYDEEGSKLCQKICDEAQKQNVQILLPIDFVAANGFKSDAATKAVTMTEGIEDGWMGLDIGKQSAKIFREAVESASSVVWNGPMGVFEWPAFEKGTKTVLDAMLIATCNGALTIVGGGDSASAVAKWGAESGLSHVSTGGGASIELLEGKNLPGISCLTDKI